MTGVRGALTLCVLLAVAGPGAAETLGDVFRDHGVQAGPRMKADTPISSYAVLAEAAQFVVAYYKREGGNAAPLHVSRRERASGQWRHAVFDGKSARKVAPDCLGSVLSVRAAGPALLVETHVSPSASCTFVLSSLLALEDVVSGWPLAVFADGRMAYQRSQPHFFAVHPLEILLYDPRTRKSVALYPPAPSPPLRAAYVAQLRSAYTDAWCRAENHPCDPERFDERIEGPVVLAEKGRGLAFVVIFEDRALPGTTAGAIYVYRGVGDRGPAEVREIAPEEVGARCGELALARCLDPGALGRLFSP